MPTILKVNIRFGYIPAVGCLIHFIGQRIALKYRGSGHFFESSLAPETATTYKNVNPVSNCNPIGDGRALTANFGGQLAYPLSFKTPETLPTRNFQVHTIDRIKAVELLYASLYLYCIYSAVPRSVRGR